MLCAVLCSASAGRLAGVAVATSWRDDTTERGSGILPALPLLAASTRLRAASRRPIQAKDRSEPSSASRMPQARQTVTAGGGEERIPVKERTRREETPGREKTAPGTSLSIVMPNPRPPVRRRPRKDQTSASRIGGKPRLEPTSPRIFQSRGSRVGAWARPRVASLG